MKQYNKSKPHKKGYKVFVLSGISGFSYDLEVYTVEQHELEPNEVDIGASSNVVMCLCRTVPTGVGYHMYFDSYFTSLRLLTELAQRQIQSIGTVGLNRLPGIGGPSEAEIKKAVRETVSEYLTDVDGIKTSCVRWFDNKLVSLVSTFVGAVPIGNARRWFRKENVFKEIARPQIISIYNKHMGGVDTLDSLMGLCSITIHSKKYYQRICFHCFDLAVVNSWLLYGRSRIQQSIDGPTLTLADYKAELAESKTFEIYIIQTNK